MTAGGEGAFILSEINVEEENFTGDLQIILLAFSGAILKMKRPHFSV